MLFLCCQRTVCNVRLLLCCLFRGHGSKSFSNSRSRAIVQDMLRQMRMDRGFNEEKTAKHEFLRGKCLQSWRFTCHFTAHSAGCCVIEHECAYVCVHGSKTKGKTHQRNTNKLNTSVFLSETLNTLKTINTRQIMTTNAAHPYLHMKQEKSPAAVHRSEF